MARPKKEVVLDGATAEATVSDAASAQAQTNQKPNLTPISQVKLAVAIPGTTTQTLMEKQYSLMYDSEKMVLYVHKKEAGKTQDKYVIFPPNIAYMKL